ncbi:hypothetical protein LXA43DRAFT_1097234 [Ganoderma leucocontextum]|nr:hypothetical protein LXA43DRAFT_1097234 [Ganoderma leucocontextum]
MERVMSARGEYSADVTAVAGACWRGEAEDAKEQRQGEGEDDEEYVLSSSKKAKCATSKQVVPKDEKKVKSEPRGKLASSVFEAPVASSSKVTLSKLSTASAYHGLGKTSSSEGEASENEAKDKTTSTGSKRKRTKLDEEHIDKFKKAKEGRLEKAGKDKKPVV